MALMKNCLLFIPTPSLELLNKYCNKAALHFVCLQLPPNEPEVFFKCIDAVKNTGQIRNSGGLIVLVIPDEYNLNSFVGSF